MSKLKDFVSRGVRLIVADTPGASPPPEGVVEEEGPEPTRARPRAPADAPVETFESARPRPVGRSSVPANVEDWKPVYEEAGIALPPHGYGVEKVAEMLQSKRLANLGREVKATAVLAALEAATVPVRDVVQDAVLRDKALDAFEAAKQKELGELRTRNEARMKSLQDEVQGLLQKINAEIEGLKKQSTEAEAAFAALQQRKQREEERLFEVVSYFIDGGDNPVTAARPAAKAPGPKTEA
jgi:hypothetical protein